MTMVLYCAHPTATKPLSPSHIKGMLWFDLLARATQLVAPVTVRANRVTCDITVQNLGFWSYLDRHVGADPALYADKDDLWIGCHYLRYHAASEKADASTLERLRRRVEDDSWMHPASRRVLALWAEQCRILGIDGERALGTWTPLPLTVTDCVAALEELGVLLDVRHIGGCAYLDFTADGVFLRQTIDEHGTPNYLVHVLRELLPAVHAGEPIVLGFDSESSPDFEIVARVLRRAGAEVHTVAIDRIHLPGVQGTSRAGGWQPYVLPTLIDRLVPRYGVDPFRLGMRMYFVMQVGRRSRQAVTFDADALEKFVRKAARLVEALTDEEHEIAAMQAWLCGLWNRVADRHRVFADPARLLPVVLAQANRSSTARAVARRLVLSDVPTAVAA